MRKLLLRIAMAALAVVIVAVLIIKMTLAIVPAIPLFIGGIICVVLICGIVVLASSDDLDKTNESKEE